MDSSGPFKDRILRCIDCQEEFVYTASTQEYFSKRSFSEDPKRCKLCYLELKKAERLRRYNVKECTLSGITRQCIWQENGQRCANEAEPDRDYCQIHEEWRIATEEVERKLYGTSAKKHFGTSLRKGAKKPAAKKPAAKTSRKK